MENIKKFLKKWPSLYRFSQNIYHGFRKIVETNLIGTVMQEWVWRSRKKDWAESYLKTESHPHRQTLVEKIESYAPFRSVLEIGCASGPNLILLARKFPDIKIKGIDINKKAIEVGNNYFKEHGFLNVEILKGKADNLNQFKDKSFDVVFTDAVLIYVGQDKIRKVASDMVRITKKAIILLEQHSEIENALGIYNKGNWLRNYRILFQPYTSQIKITKISPEIWGGNWGELGYIIEILL